MPRMGWTRKWYFLIGFAKNESDNVDEKERRALWSLAQELLGLTVTDLARPEWLSALEEISHDGEDEDR